MFVNWKVSFSFTTDSGLALSRHVPISWKDCGVEGLAIIGKDSEERSFCPNPPDFLLTPGTGAGF